MSDMEINRCNAVLMEHLKAEDETVERFQALSRTSSLRQISRGLDNLSKEKVLLTEGIQVLERKLAALENEKQATDRENQRLQNDTVTLRGSLDEEHAKRKRSEQVQANRIEDHEKSIQTLQRDKRNLESELNEATNNQRRRAESDMERIRNLTEENSSLKEEIRHEKLERRTSCLTLQGDVSSKERLLREAEAEKARLKELIDISENQRIGLDRTIAEFRNDNSELRAEKTRLEIQRTNEEQQYNFRMLEIERESLLKDQEIRNLKERLVAEVRIRQDYIRKNSRTSEEITSIRMRLDAVDQEQRNNRQVFAHDIMDMQSTIL